MENPERDAAHLEFNRHLRHHYTDLLRQHGDSPLTAQWAPGTQHVRFAVLTEIGLPPTASILDFGCGIGDFLEYLRSKQAFTGAYVGYDLSEEIIAHARKKYAADPNARFECRDIFEGTPEEEFDYVFASGTFNIRSEEADSYVRRALSLLYRVARKGLAFNLMSTYVDFFDPTLYYADPEEVFRFCKEHLSPCVTLRHDYLLKPGTIPFEFAVYVHKTLIRTVQRHDR